MLGHPPARLAGWFLMALTALLALTVAGSGVLAASACKKVNGKVTLQTFSGPSCLSPVGQCGASELRGDLAGTGAFIGTSVTPTADTPTTGVILLTGDNTLTTAGGTLLLKEAVLLRTTGAGDFAEVDAIVGGTGVWAGASGAIRAQGLFDAASSTGAGEYIGEVCAP